MNDRMRQRGLTAGGPRAFAARGMHRSEVKYGVARRRERLVRQSRQSGAQFRFSASVGCWPDARVREQVRGLQSLKEGGHFLMEIRCNRGEAPPNVAPPPLPIGKPTHRGI